MKRLFLAFLIGLAACSGKSTGPEIPNFEGTWTMVGINGFSLPYALTDLNGVRTEYLSETLTITSSTFTRTAQIRVTTATGTTQQTATESGTYYYDSRAILRSSSGYEGWCTFDTDGKLLLHFGGAVLSYQRQ